MAWTAFPLLIDGQIWTGAHTQIVKANFDSTAPALATTAGAIFVATGTNTIAQRIPATDLILSSDTVTATAYANTTTPGPSVTSTTSTKALLSVSGYATNSAGSQSTYMSVETSGATAISASDTWGLEYRDSGANGAINATRLHLETALTSGSNTFNVKYRVTSPTGTVQRRHLTVIPF